MGEGYGPVVVAAQPMSVADLEGKRIGVPGLTTTAFTVPRMMVPNVEPVVTPITPYSLIFDALRSGQIDAGLIIHEGRLTYEDEGFVQVVDEGVWWAEQTGGLPLPLGANSIKRSLGPTVIAEVSDLLRRSIAHGLDDLDAAVDWLLAKGGPLDTPARVRQYLAMYANDRTLDYGDAGRAGVAEFLRRASAEGWIDAVDVDWSP